MINISILSFLTRWWVDTFAGLNKAKRVEARAAYLKFAETFTPFIRHLELEDTNLDSLIEEEFPKHDLARYNFMRYLDASCRKRFDEKWLQYKKHYEQIAEVHKQWETVRLRVELIMNIGKILPELRRSKPRCGTVEITAEKICLTLSKRYLKLQKGSIDLLLVSNILQIATNNLKKFLNLVTLHFK